MPTVYQEVAVNFDISDFDDDDLIEELESRDYIVRYKDDGDEHPDIEEAIWRYKNGYIEDAVLLLERQFPELTGLSKRIIK